MTVEGRGAREPLRDVRLVALLAFLSGLSALVYQIVWLREFRLIFGASTAATSAVLAIFMGGLGLGSHLLGPRADRHPNALALYARLEAGIALAAAATPAAFALVRQAYIWTGGTSTLGTPGAIVVRFALAAVVLAIPTTLMGGTLPAAVRAVEPDADRSRRAAAIIYSSNTLGAVAGCLLGTFLLVEALGNRWCLWSACAANALAALLARLASARNRPVFPSRARATPPPTESGNRPGEATPAAFVLAAATIVGAAFFLMEMVWYRMLGPLLGGTTFTFGLILAVALAGIGVGGALFPLIFRGRSPTLASLGYSCLAEAACVASPLALGDRVAILAATLRASGGGGFGDLVLGWTAVALLVVLPPAIVAGIQFPLLIALLGGGRRDVGRHVGSAYAWNTAGALAGSLAGGFVLLPLLGAPGCWRSAAIALASLGTFSLAVASRERLPLARALCTLALGGVTAAMVRAPGPTPAWRHAPVGAGRVTAESIGSPNAVQAWLNTKRRSIVREIEGIESSVGIDVENGLAFILIGKSDGHAKYDGGTQIMGGLVGAVLHGSVERALVIGLGTGSTAGWLGDLPTVSRVDVVELEPAILEVARACAPVNRGVLDNPKVRVRIEDAREALLTTRDRYDLVFSEPSNPYRAGVASLFTREFYAAVRDRLEERGVFLQWLQAYEVDERTVRTVYATLSSTFPYVETWQTLESDLLLVASAEPFRYDVRELRARIREEPFRAALLSVWRAADLEGFLARFVARPGLAEALTSGAPVPLNTDDRTGIEFAFARTAGAGSGVDVEDLRRLAGNKGLDRPPISAGVVDWTRVSAERLALPVIEGRAPGRIDFLGSEGEPDLLAVAYARWVEGDRRAALDAWSRLGCEPAGPTELALVAEALAEAGDERAARYAEQLRAFQPGEADAALARLQLRQGQPVEAATTLERVFARFRVDPWPLRHIMRDSLALAREACARDRRLAPRMFQALEAPFALHLFEDTRKETLFAIATRAQQPYLQVRALRGLEPHVPWRRAVLAARRDLYRLLDDPLLPQAEADLATFERQARSSAGGEAADGGD